jgi:DnaA family protein
MYVPLPADSPAVLADLEQVDLLAIDDLESVAGDLEWERPLFAILNANLERHGSLLLAAAAPATQCGFRLPDLASRGAGAVTYKLAQLNDAERAAALRLHAAARGLVLEPAAAEFLLKRVSRDMAALTVWPDGFDRNTLFVNEMRHFIEVCQGREAPGCGLDEGCASLAIIQAARQGAPMPPGAVRT